MLFEASSLRSILNMFFWNIIIVSFYHFVIFLCSAKRSQSKFDSNKARYQPLRIEKQGRLYISKFKIKRWKDHVPQFVGKEGFSKEHLPNHITANYIDEFISETCRAEWTHEWQLCAILFTILANPMSTSWFFTLIVLLINVPCTFIQRYNRFRLQALQKRMAHVPISLPVAA